MKFRKEIIRLGKYVLPDGDGELDVTPERLRAWLEATRAAGVKTWVPYRHSRDPRDNCGFVEGFEVADGILYGVFDITDEEAAKKISEGTIKDVSIGVGPVRKETGEEYAEVIKHVALVMDPHVREQGEFQALMEAGDLTFAFSASDKVQDITPEWAKLPMRAQELYESEYKWALAEYEDEKIAEDIAWHAVKQNYHKVRGEWKRKKPDWLKMESDSLITRLAYKVGLLNGRTKGGEDLDVKELSEKVEKQEIRLEALESDKVKLEAERDEWAAKFEASEKAKAEADAKIAEFEAAEKERKVAEREAFEAEAGEFADKMVKALKAEPAVKDKWVKLYLTDKELALESAKTLKVKFEGDVDGEPQDRKEPSKLDRADPKVVGMLEAMGYDKEAIERHLGEEE